MNEMNELIPYNQLEAFTRTTEPFPVDFDDVWVWVGYNHKKDALRRLKKRFKEGLDWVFTQMGKQTDEVLLTQMGKQTDGVFSQMAKQRGRGGHNINKYYLSLDCFMGFCLLAGTEQGERIREALVAMLRAMRETRNPPRNDVLPGPDEYRGGVYIVNGEKIYCYKGKIYPYRAYMMADMEWDYQMGLPQKDKKALDCQPGDIYEITED
jgi:hypothetical protein